MNEIWELLSVKQADVQYEQVKYQAWRYQDTPASWAYLYEQFSSAFLGKKNGICSFLQHHFRLLKLNIEREGWWSLILFFILASASIMGVMVWTPIREYFQSITARISWSIIGGLSFVISIKNFRQAYLTKAINIISKYGVKTSFKNTLGIQAEIQKELVDLINAWIPDGKKNKLILCVDDLDRCNEEKTIEIIDALRIILDDDDLKEKLLVLTAIDERILLSAIKNKYKDLGVGSEMVREYVDKLFIFSVKLGPLDREQSKDFFQKLVKNDLVEVEIPQSKPETNPASQNDFYSQDDPVDQSERDQKPPKSKENDVVPNKLKKIKKLSVDEAKLIADNLGLIKNSTPRKIRILYYRYLFAKNLLIINNGGSDQNDYWLEDPHHDYFIKLLIHFSDSETSEIVNQIKQASETESAKSPVDESIVDTSNYIRLLKILELTIAY